VAPTPAGQPPAAGRSRWVGWLGGILVVAATAVTFRPVLENDFVNWDDVAVLLTNPHYRGLGWANLRWMFTTTLMGHYVPLTWLSFAMNFMLGGMHPWGYHLVNLMLHAANAGVFYLVARRLLTIGFAGGITDSGTLAKTEGLRDPTLCAGAAFAALVFGVHPLRVESVAWATERRDVLCGLFYLLATLAYLRGVDGGGAIRMRCWVLSVGAFLLSLLAKAAAVPLPIALLLLDVYPLRRVQSVGWRRLVIEKVPYLVLAGGAGVAALIAQSQARALADYRHHGFGSRLAAMSYSLVFYPWKFLWSANLSPFYELPPTADLLAPRFLLATVALVLVSGLLIALRRRVPAVLAAWVYSALLLLPVSGVAQAGVHLVADRYSYLSGLGFALLVGAGLIWALRTSQSASPAAVGACVLVAALILVGLGAATWRQNTIWHDTGTLWRHALRVDPGNARAHFYLGYWLYVTDRQQEARDEYQQALRLTESAGLRTASLNGIAGSLNKQAMAQAQRGEIQQALTLLTEARRIAPEFLETCRSLRNLAGIAPIEPKYLDGCSPPP
jgi:protein O-mannosyl-transferase